MSLGLPLYYYRTGATGHYVFDHEVDTENNMMW